MDMSEFIQWWKVVRADFSGDPYIGLDFNNGSTHHDRR